MHLHSFIWHTGEIDAKKQTYCCQGPKLWESFNDWPKREQVSRGETLRTRHLKPRVSSQRRYMLVIQWAEIKHNTVNHPYPQVLHPRNSDICGSEICGEIKIPEGSRKQNVNVLPADHPHWIHAGEVMCKYSGASAAWVLKERQCYIVVEVARLFISYHCFLNNAAQQLFMWHIDSYKSPRDDLKYMGGCACVIGKYYAIEC